MTEPFYPIHLRTADGTRLCKDNWAAGEDVSVTSAVTCKGCLDRIDPKTCPKCSSKRTAVREYGFRAKRVCFDCWHEWLIDCLLTRGDS